MKLFMSFMGACERMRHWNSLSPEIVTDLLEVCLRSTYMYFSYNREFYEQREGAAMGSPVSVII